ncbi:MAG TPA: DeoR/GlpR family DNA-binding transcription regulator [Euzebyales bacterium]|nr:DeoR/GlpR family DNA-binding transcription regulator [Euzebyales bacterium]
MSRAERTPDNADARMPQIERRDRITELLDSMAFVRVSDLSQRFGVSEVTIRTDLETLDAEGQLRRVRGGAVSMSRVGREPSYAESLGDRADEKAAIGAIAAALVSPGESVFLDVGTTTTAVARALVQRDDLEDIVVLTNALPIALELEPAIPRFSVILTGGTLRPLQHSLVNPLATRLLEQLHVDTGFIGCTGVAWPNGVTNVNLPEAEIKRHIAHKAGRRILVADGSKVGAVSLAPVCALDEIDLLITGPSASADDLEELEAHDLAVEVAGRAGR